MTPARAALSAIDPRLAELVAPLRRLAVPASILVLALAAAYNMRYGSAQLRSADFPSFYQAGLALRAGHDPYLPAMAFVHAYTPGGNGTYFAARAYVYAPFFALLMVPLTLLPTYPALTVWDLLNVAFLVLAVGAAVAGVPATSPASAGTPRTAAEGPIAAVGAENQYADVIAQVGGRYVRVSSIMSNPNADPHAFEASPAVAAEAPAAAEETLPEVGTAETGEPTGVDAVETGEPTGVDAVEVDEPVEVEDDASEDEMAELPDDGLGGERVEKLPARKPAVRRRSPAAKKPAPGGDRPAPRTEEE